MENKRERKRVKDLFNRWPYLLKLFKLLLLTSPKEFIIMMVVTISIGLLPLLTVYSLQELVNAVTNVGGQDIEEFPLQLTFWLTLFVLALILQYIGRIYGDLVRDHMQERMKVDIQGMIIKKAHHLSLAQFENPEFYDQLQRANRGLEGRLFSTMFFIVNSIRDIITIFSLLIFLLFIHWSIPLILFIGSTIFTIIQVRLFTEQYLLDRKQTTEMRKMSYLEHLMTTRESAKEIRLYGLGEHLRENWKELNKKLMAERIQLARRESRQEWISSNGNTMIFAIVLTAVVYIATLGLLSVGKYAAFINAVLQFQEALGDIYWSIAVINKDLRYIKDFFDYLELPEEESKGELLLEEPLKQGIICENMSFTYPGAKKEVFHNMNFHIFPGEKIALVGLNGSGKTTLVKLLLGLYQPSSGRILVEGTDLRSINLSSWRKRCTAIFQDFHKYHMTVKNNIAVGQIDRIQDIEQIKKAAMETGADEMIQKLPSGYYTLLGKEFNGQELSQGQWQKLALARAYIREADLLILDEPTASLDPQAEVEVYKQFQVMAKDKTTIFISHRLGICKLVDRIIVLHNSSIVEQGSHSELMLKNGHYANMYRLQAQWYA